MGASKKRYMYACSDGKDSDVGEMGKNKCSDCSAQIELSKFNFPCHVQGKAVVKYSSHCNSNASAKGIYWIIGTDQIKAELYMYISHNSRFLNF